MYVKNKTAIRPFWLLKGNNVIFNVINDNNTIKKCLCTILYVHDTRILYYACLLYLYVHCTL